MDELESHTTRESTTTSVFSTHKGRFICQWGKLCTNWGVNKTMGQIHALLLIAENPMCADEIMEQLSMSRGNVNMNLHALVNWQLVEKVHISGQRKDFYQAEKDLGKVFKIIVAERKKKELDPLLKLLDEVDAVQPRCSETTEFCRMTKELHRFAKKANHALSSISYGRGEWISKILLR